jgi:hypothetical protein
VCVIEEVIKDREKRGQKRKSAVLEINKPKLKVKQMTNI